MNACNPPELTVDYLKSHLSYDPKTGFFIWLENGKPSNIVKKGARAGCKKKSSGYRVIGFFGSHIPEGRLAWLYMTGEWPALHVDHINGVKDDNRWENLRLATGSENQFNRGLSKKNTSGFKGVHWHKRDRRWRVSIRSGDGSRVQASFLNYEKACEFASETILKLHGEFAKLD